MSTYPWTAPAIRSTVPAGRPRRLAALVLAAAAGLALPASLGSAPPRAASGAVVPLAAQARISASLGAHLASYRVRGLAAENPAQRLQVRFAPDRVRVNSVSLALAAVGGRAVGATQPRAAGNRVTYARGGVREWYVNGPLGLEQGFDVAARPARGLSLTLIVGGTTHARQDGASILLGDGLRYTAPTATDARGRSLPARAVLRHGQITLLVADRGARYPVRIDPFVQQAKLTSGPSASGDLLGISVALSGDTLAVGADQGTGGAGQVEVFVKGPGGWADATQTATLTASDGVSGDDLGVDVAIDGDTIVATSHHNHSRGAVYVFTKPAGGWADEHEAVLLTPSDTADNTDVAQGVAVSGDTVALGIYGKQVGSDPFAGAVYVFTKPPGGWGSVPGQHESAQLTASDHTNSDSLGRHIAMLGSVIVATDHRGGVYEYDEPAGGWSGNQTETTRIASDGDPNLTSNLFPSPALDGNVLVVGYLNSRVDVYVRPAAGWAGDTGPPTATLTTSDSSGAEFGVATAVSGNTIVAGDLERAWVFTGPAGGWVSDAHPQELLPPDPGIGKHFGVAVAAGPGTAVVGAPHVLGFDPRIGAAYVFGPSSSGGAGGGGGATTTGTGAAAPPSSTTTSARAPARLRAATAIKLGSASSVCSSKRQVTLRFAAPKGASIVKAVIAVASKSTTYTGKKLTPTISLKRLPKGTFTVKVKITLADGRTATLSRKYTTCAKKKKHHR